MGYSDLEPISLHERINVVDIIRGVALFAILFENMAMFRLDYFTGIWVALGIPVAPMAFQDQAAIWIGNLFITGRFLPILAMLFGWGLYKIMERAEQKGVSSKSILLRRLLILMGFGILHYVFIWYGDILMSFAVSGAFLLLFMRMSTDSLRKLIIGWTILGVLVIGLVSGILFSLIAAMEPAELVNIANMVDTFMALSLEVLQEGSYWEVVWMRAPMVLIILFVLPFAAPFTLISFLVGLYAAKAKVVDRLIHDRSMLRQALMLALLSAVLGLGISTLVIWMSDNLLLLAVAGILGTIGWIGQILFYILVLIRLGSSDRFRGLLRPFIPVGQMSLTVYLMQSVIATLILYGYGLGLADRVGPAEGILLTIGIFACQMIFCWLWLKYFSFGPVEWLWRRLMYGRGVRFRAAPSKQ